MSIETFRVLDLETTGMEPPAEIIEFGWADMSFDTETKQIGYAPFWETELFRPMGPIPPDTKAVHHITEEMVRDCEEWGPVDKSRLVHAHGGRFVVAHNAAFEQKWLGKDLPEGLWWIDTWKCARRIWPDCPSFSNWCLTYYLGLDKELDMTLAMPAHRAGPDAYVTARLLGKMLETETVKDLVSWTLAPAYYPTCPLGKWRDKPWGVIDAGYLRWMAGNGNDIEDDVKAAARDELARRGA